ncbi:MAG: hypothetical protein ACTS9Y_00100 [Methylophilus sp.]|uniref:hypothetical protein n=1 Tax=Methylophilus sp. TaxID=29541 RepID=UPI003FA1768E
MKAIPGISSTLNLLLAFSKKSNADFSLPSVQKALAAMYTIGMPYPEVVHLVSACWMEAVENPNFKLGNKDAQLRDMILAPVRGNFAVNTGSGEPHDQYSVRQFYESMLKKMLTDLSLSNIEWVNDREGCIG